MAEIMMTKMKETKGTVVYESKDVNAAISVVYVKKTGLPATPPENIKISLETL